MHFYITFLLFSYMYKEKEMCPLFIDHYITTCILSTDHGELELVCQDDLWTGNQCSGCREGVWVYQDSSRGIIDPSLTYFRYINDMYMYLSVIQILDIKLRLSKINLVVSDIYRSVLALEIQSFTTWNRLLFSV